MILKLEILLRKSEARGAYGFTRCLALPLVAAWPFNWVETWWVVPFERSTGTTWEGSLGVESPLVCGHIFFRGERLFEGEEEWEEASGCREFRSSFKTTPKNEWSQKRVIDATNQVTRSCLFWKRRITVTAVTYSSFQDMQGKIK